MWDIYKLGVVIMIISHYEDPNMLQLKP